MGRKADIITGCIFIFIVFVVGIVQAITEIRDKGRIQFFDVVEDTFITPNRRARTIANYADSLRQNLAAIRAVFAAQPTDYSAAEDLGDKAFATMQNLTKNVNAVNRHINLDTAAAMYKETASLHTMVNDLFSMIQDQEEASTILQALDKAEAQAESFARQHKKPGFLGSLALVAQHSLSYSIFSAKYLRGYEDEMEETSVFANTTRPYMQFFRYLLMNDLGDKALQGRKGWLFYTPDVEYLTRPWVNDIRSKVVDANDKPYRDKPVQTILSFKRQLAQRGVELLVVVMPGKPSIYPDLLNPRISADQSGKVSHSTKLIKELSDSGVAVVDLFAAFAQERKNDQEAGDSLYLATDTHWKSRAVRLAAKLVADRIKQYPWYEAGATEYVIDKVTVNRDGDVGVMTRLPDFRARDLRMHFPLEPTVCYQVFEVVRDEEGNEVRRQLYKDEYRSSSILLLGDSFSRIYQTDPPGAAGWIAHLAYELSQPIATIVSDGGASTLVRETLVRKMAEAIKEGNRTLLDGKKIVVWEFVERDVRFGAEGWKELALPSKAQ